MSSLLLSSTLLSAITTPSESNRVYLATHHKNNKRTTSYLTRSRLGFNPTFWSTTFRRRRRDPRCCLSMPVEGPTSSSQLQDSLLYCRAYWVSRSRIAWNVDAEDGSCYLYASKTAFLSVTNDGIQGYDVRIKLEVDNTGLSENVTEKFPHIRHYKAFKVPSTLDFKSLVKCQLAVAIFNSDGKWSAATGLQLPGVLDELFSYNGPLGAVQARRLLLTAMAVESDLDLAFQLQIQEAMNASLAPQPSSSSSSSSSSSFASFLDEEIARFEQEHGDHDHAEAEMRRIRDDLNRRIHDQAFALDMSRISEEEWVNTGDHFVRPYGEGSSSSSSSVGVSNAEAFRLYFKGLVREERVGGGVKKMSAGIGIAICDLGDYPIFELRKPLFGCDEMSHQVAEVKALIEGLNAAISLGIKRITIICDDNSVYQYVTGKAMPMQGNIAAFLGQVTLLQRNFSYCSPSLVAQKDIKFALKLASEAIVSQGTCLAESSRVKNMKETCSICFEDTDVCQMFSVNDCLHRYCSSCLKKHVEVKLLQGMLPKCPHDACKTELKIESCKNFLTSELHDLMSQRIKEYSIPATQKIYCPYPRCSALMSKAEALVTTNNAGASMCERCRGLFCMSCKAPWHSNVSCNDYKILNPYPCAEDAKLNSLARRNLWRQCVKCNHMVELAEGCNHIYCRCGYEFCYICGAEWKNKKATCRCPLWDERNIVYDQQNRHQQRLG